jgi:hypothetical protein
MAAGPKEPSSASGSEDDDGSRLSNEDGDDDEHDSKRRSANSWNPTWNLDETYCSSERCSMFINLEIGIESSLNVGLATRAYLVDSFSCEGGSELKVWICIIAWQEEGWQVEGCRLILKNNSRATSSGANYEWRRYPWRWL